MLPSKSILTLLLAVISFLFSKAQDHSELLNKLNDSKDTTRVNVLIEIGKTIRRQNLDSAVLLFDQAFVEAVKLGFVRGQIQAVMSKGIGYGMNNQYAECILAFKQVSEIAIQNNDLDNLASAYNNLGIVYKRIGDYPTSYDYYNRCLETNKIADQDADLSFVYTNLGILHDLMKEYDKSFEFYQKALEETRRTGRDSTAIYTNLGIYYMRVEKYDQAIQLYRNTHFNSDEEYDFFNSANNLSNIYHKINKFDSAIYFSTVVIDSADTYRGDVVTNSYYNRANAYLAISDFPNALNDALLAAKMSENFGFQLRHQSYEVLTKVYEKMGQMNNAYEALKMVLAYQDSLFESEKVKSFKEEEVKQDIYAKNLQLESQQAELEQLGIKADRDKFLKLFLVTLAGVLIIFIILLYQRYSLKNQMTQILVGKNKVITSQKNEIELINEQLEGRMLRAQINPHFIFNALNSIQHFIAQNDRKTALSYLTKFSSLLRQILENSINVMVTIEDELKSLKTYLEIESLRFDGAFEYQIHVDSEVDTHKHEVPILLLQPFTENAILHGLMPKDGDKLLRISVGQKDNFIIYQIEDNGVGREEAKKRKTKQSHTPSRGMSVTAQRIALLKSKSQSAEVLIEDQIGKNGHPEGTRVIIKIPVS